MSRAAQAQPRFKVKPLVDQILETGNIRRQEYLQLTSAILSDRQITDEERRQINRVFDYLQIGRLKLID